MTVIIWVLGFSALIWGLVSLHGIFSQERSDASSEILSRHETLEQYAFQALTQSLQQQIAFTKVNLSHVLRDPLISSANILYFEANKQLLPRPSLYLKSAEVGNRAKQLYQELMDVEPVDIVIDKLTPWEEYLNLLGNFKLAVESQNASEIRWAFRDIREQRARSPIVDATDIPYMIALLDYLIIFSNPEKPLVQNFIRNGSTIEHERGNYGLQRLLIARRNLYTKQEFDFLKNKIVEFSEKFNIPYSDFLEQCQVEDQFLDIAPIEINEPSFLLNGRWYVERSDQSKLLGAAIDLDTIVENIESSMKEIGLLAQGDSVNFSKAKGPLFSLRKLSVSVISTNLDQRLQSVDGRYWLKTWLLFASAMLVAGIAALILVIQYRTQRFLSLKADFIATVSHELKTPIASVRLLSETLLRKTEAIASVKDYPSRIIKTIDSMSLLVDNILSFNRLHKGAWQLKKSSVSIEEVIASLKNEFSQYTHLPVSIQIKNLEDIEINADQELIKILFRNLVNNACKYNENEKIDISIVAQREPQLIIDIQDNGIGIAKNNWSIVFDEFYRYVDTKDKSIPGTGLGLAICKKVMQLHRGSINILNSSESGTTFRLTF